jgi:hypothetical protein
VAVFYSFHYDRDNWRVQQIMNMGVLDGQPLLNAQKWEEIKQQGRKAIEDWIDKQMAHKSAVVVLVGAQTAARPWVKYEITKAWQENRRLVGIRIHGLEDRFGDGDSLGDNPFAQISLRNGRTIADCAHLHNPAGMSSKSVYDNIAANLTSWAANARKPSD